MWDSRILNSGTTRRGCGIDDEGFAHLKIGQIVARGAFFCCVFFGVCFCLVQTLRCTINKPRYRVVVWLFCLINLHVRKKLWQRFTKRVVGRAQMPGAMLTVLLVALLGCTTTVVQARGGVEVSLTKIEMSCAREASWCFCLVFVFFLSI